MRQRRFLLSVAAVGFLVLSACAKNPENQDSYGQVTDYAETEERVTGKVGENITIDAQILNRPPRSEYELLHGQWDDTDCREQDRATFFESDAPLLECWYEDESLSRLVYKLVYDDPATLSYDMHGNPWSNRNLSIEMRNNLISYDADYSLASVCINLAIELNADGINGKLWNLNPERLCVDETAELADYPKAEATADARALLEGLGYSLCEEPVAAYAVRTAEHPEELKTALENMYGSSGLEASADANLEAEYYYFFWLDELNGLPLANSNRPDESTQGDSRAFPENGTQTVLLMQKDGPLSLERGPKFVETGREEAQPLLSLQEALAAIPAYYGGIDDGHDYKVYTVGFCYAPVQTGEVEKTVAAGEETYTYTTYEFDLIPAWYFEIESDMVLSPGTEFESFHRDMVFVNAHTGEIIE